MYTRITASLWMSPNFNLAVNQTNPASKLHILLARVWDKLELTQIKLAVTGLFKCDSPICLGLCWQSTRQTRPKTFTTNARAYSKELGHISVTKQMFILMVTGERHRITTKHKMDLILNIFYAQLTGGYYLSMELCVTGYRTQFSEYTKTITTQTSHLPWRWLQFFVL